MAERLRISAFIMTESRAVPNYFFLNNQLHMFIKVVMSDNSVVAWNYPEESRLWLPRTLVRKNFKKAYSIEDAAELIGTKSSTINELINKNLVKSPSRTYDLSNYRPLRAYINESDMLDLRQAAWDVLPKNRFGEPYNDSMANEDQLLHRMALGDDREYYLDDDGFQQIYKA